MDLLWEHGPSTVAEVRDRLGDDLAYTTVLTILRTLGEQGLYPARSRRPGPSLLRVIERDVARQSALNALSKKLFKGSTELLLTHLVSDRKLSNAQLARIKELLEQRTKKERT